MISSVTYTVSHTHSLYPLLIEAMQGTENSRSLRELLVRKPCGGRLARQNNTISISLTGPFYEIHAWIDAITAFTNESPVHSSGFIHNRARDK